MRVQSGTFSRSGPLVLSFFIRVPYYFGGPKKGPQFRELPVWLTQGMATDTDCSNSGHFVALGLPYGALHFLMHGLGFREVSGLGKRRVSGLGKLRV